MGSKIHPATSACCFDHLLPNQTVTDLWYIFSTRFKGNPATPHNLGIFGAVDTCPTHSHIVHIVQQAEEKQALRFVRLMQKLQSSGVLKELGLVPLLAGATGDEAYAAQAGSAGQCRAVPGSAGQP